MERRTYEQLAVAPPDPGLRRPPSPEEIARREEVFRQMMEDRKTAPKVSQPVVEMLREVRDQWERRDG